VTIAHTFGFVFGDIASFLRAKDFVSFALLLR